MHVANQAYTTQLRSDAAEFIRATLADNDADNAIADAWLKRNGELRKAGVDNANLLTDAAVEELHKLGYITEDIIVNGNNIRAYQIDGTTALNGLNAILGYHKGFV